MGSNETVSLEAARETLRFGREVGEQFAWQQAMDLVAVVADELNEDGRLAEAQLVHERVWRRLRDDRVARLGE